MKLIKETKIALKTLGAHKMRTALAVIGIVLGVSAVVLLVAVGKGRRSRSSELCSELSDR